MNGLLTILMLTFFVVMHEAGHYFAARFSKVAVSEFFVGFGPKIFSFKKNGTEYGLKGIPFGGYVKIPGMDESEATKDYAEDELFHTSKWTTKLFIASAGIIVNFITAWIILFSIFIFNGVAQPTLQIDTIGQSVNNEKLSPSEFAGLKPGDTITQFNGLNVESWEDLVKNIEINPNKEVSIKYIRNGGTYLTTTVLESRNINGNDLGYLGVSPVIEQQNVGIINSAIFSTKLEYEMTLAAVDGIFTLLSPENIRTLLGTYSGQDIPDESRPLSPIGLAQAGSQIADNGYVNLFSLLAFVNVFLAVFNAIPLIPLDGGRVLLSLIEGITGKKIPDKNLYPIAALVIIVFVFIGITAFYLDITQPINL